MDLKIQASYQHNLNNLLFEVCLKLLCVTCVFYESSVLFFHRTCWLQHGLFFFFFCSPCLNFQLLHAGVTPFICLSDSKLYIRLQSLVDIYSNVIIFWNQRFNCVHFWWQTLMGIVFKTLDWHHIRLDVHLTSALNNCAVHLWLNIFILAMFNFWAFSVFWSALHVYTLRVCI